MTTSSVEMVTGQAGTGKTTWLMSRAKELADKLITEEHHRLLVLTRMHGARRRLESELDKSCAGIPKSVATIDGFALSILNKFRLSLGFTKPVVTVDNDTKLTEALFETEGGFDAIRVAAADLLRSTTVKSVIAESHPLIIVDEFQDCHGSLLEFVTRLSECTNVVLAADEFQLLDTSISGCPAVDGIRALYEANEAAIEELTTIHRTSSFAILEAARCLRTAKASATITVPVICCPQHGPMAWHIISRLVLCDASKRWKGSTALICPSHDPFLAKVIASCDGQLKKRQLKPLSWSHEKSAEDEILEVSQALGLDSTANSCTDAWPTSLALSEPVPQLAASKAIKLAKLRGLRQASKQMVFRAAERVVHDRRAYSACLPSRCITTVHGAKNREFDNVFVVWTYKLPQGDEAQRRLLYNAVTRAKLNCVVLVWGDVSRANDDTVLSLLGPPQPAFKNKRNKGTEKMLSATRSGN